MFPPKNTLPVLAAKARELIEDADSVVVGAGAGLSEAAGFTSSGPRFQQYFSDFGRKYGMTDMYKGGFYPFRSREETWAYWSRYIFINRYMDPPKPVYKSLLSLLWNKDYFVLTTNVDHCFQKAGFNKDRLFYVQGDYGEFQCSIPCQQRTYENEDVIRQMVEQQQDMRVPTSLLPRCPHCGAPMTTHLRVDGRFVQDEGWHDAADRYYSFLRSRQRGKMVFLELGVGYNTPGIIRYPFDRMSATYPDANLIRLNRDRPELPPALREKGVSIGGDLAEAIDAIHG